MNLTMRALGLAEVPVAAEIFRAAYRTTLDVQPRLRQVLRLQPDGWFLAVLDDTPIGMGGTVDYGPFAYIGMIGVHPRAQRRGIGIALVEHVLAWLDHRQCPMSLLNASDAGASLYPRLGFQELDRAIHWERDRSGLIPPFSAQAMQLATLKLSDIDELTAFDAPYFGAGRASVFTTLLIDFPDRAFVVRDEQGQLSGYLFAQRSVLGPWAASSEEAAELLLSYALTLSYAGEQTVYSPMVNGQASNLLERYGFRRLRTLSHMSRGDSLLLQQRENLYGQASLGLG